MDNLEAPLIPLTLLTHLTPTHSVRVPETLDERALPHPVVGIERVKASKSGLIRLGNNLNESNWIVWQLRMKIALESCGALAYVTRALQCLDAYADPQGSKTWSLNNAFTCMQIQCNITEPQMVHASQCTTAHEMWKSLEGVHNNKGHQALIVYLWNFYCLAAKEGDNIIIHLNKMKKGRKCINMMGNPRFYIPNITFKILICQSLPSTWDNFMDTYIGSQTFNQEDPRMSTKSQNLIRILKTEYNRHVGQKLESSQSSVTPQVNQTRVYK
jgi:hypothetical protein